MSATFANMKQTQINLSISVAPAVPCFYSWSAILISVRTDWHFLPSSKKNQTPIGFFFSFLGGSGAQLVPNMRGEQPSSE